MSTWPAVLGRLVAGSDLTEAEAGWGMRQILDGIATPAQCAAFVIALRAKGETVTEVTALADTMLAFATPLPITTDAVDIVGSGGDQARTVNVSTMAALVVAGTGVRVVKHGNRAASSASGAADVLEALGIPLDLTPAQQVRVIDTAGIGFLFARAYHPALRHAGPVRSELGVPTTFNVLGPLTNPGRPVAHAVGIADARMAGLVAGVLAGRGSRGVVFHGGDGLDELTTTTDSTVWLMADGTVSTDTLDPLDLGVPRATVDDLVGGSPEHNAEVVRRVAAGDEGPVTDIVALNAAAGLLAYAGVAHGVAVAEQLRPHLARARSAIADGAMAAALERWLAVCRDVTS